MTDEQGMKQPEPGSPQLTDSPVAMVAAASPLQRLLASLKHFKTAIVAIAGVGAVVSGLVGYYGAYKTVVGVSPSTSVASDPGAINPLSIMVLPFANQTGDAAKAYIADALTTSVTTDLSRIREALVIGTATAFTYRDKPTPLPQIGREVGVRYLLQGSVQSDGLKIRIQAQLAEAKSGAQIWSETFDGDSTQLFSLQDQITNRIANSIGREIVVLAARESESHPNPKAADLMFQAIALETQRRTLETTQRRESLYRQVLKLEPKNANAMARLSRVLWFYQVFPEAVPADVGKAKKAEAYEWAFKARDIDPNNVFALQSIARFYGDKGDLQGRRNAIETALALEPKNAGLLGNAAVLMLDLDEPARAMEYAKLALQLDPRSQVRYAATRSIGFAMFRQGQYAGAIEWIAKGLSENDPEPTGAMLALAYELSGNHAQAQATRDELFARFPHFDFVKEFEPVSSQPEALKAHYKDVVFPAAQRISLIR